MVKKIFILLFCNFYYHYAKAKDRGTDARIIGTIGLIFFLPLGILVGVPIFKDYIKDYKAIVWFIFMFFSSCACFAAYRWLYKNKLYLKLVEGFSEEDYKPWIFYIVLISFVALPMGLLYLVFNLV